MLYFLLYILLINVNFLIKKTLLKLYHRDLNQTDNIFFHQINNFFIFIYIIITKQIINDEKR